MLLSVILGTFLFTMAAAGYFVVLSGGFGAVKSTGEAIQAQRYAEMDAGNEGGSVVDYQNYKIYRKNRQKAHGFNCGMKAARGNLSK